MENYNRSLRDKRDLEKKVRMYEKESKSEINQIKLQKEEIHEGLLDLQSKTVGLNETLSYITHVLKEEREIITTELRKIQTQKLQAATVRVNPFSQRLMSRVSQPQSVLRVHQALTQRPNSTLLGLQLEEKRLRTRLEQADVRLNWLLGESKMKEAEKKTRVFNLVNNAKGFKAVLNRIRQRRAARSSNKNGKELDRSEPQPINLDDANNVCELIDKFHLLPKIYPTQPRKKRPQATDVLVQEYKVRKKEQEMAMSYGTRTRIRRAKHHCKSLKDLYVPPS